MYIKHTIFHRGFIILYTQRTHFLKNIQNCVHFSKLCTLYTIFNIQQTHFSKNVHNFIHLIYTIFKECKQFCKFNIHIFLKNVHNFVH